MQNETNRPIEKRHTIKPFRNKDVLFSIPTTRWEKYSLAKLSIRGGCGPEVFFDRGAEQKDIHNLEPGANQAGRLYDTEGVSPTIPTAGGGRHIPMIYEAD